jgi:hypothetical protein
MKSSVEILSLKRNKITFKVRKRNINFILPICLTMIVGFVTFFSIGGVTVSQICSSMCYIYNPVNSLYSDSSNIVFTSIYSINKETLDFVIPIIGAHTIVEDNGDIVMTVGNSIMVKAIESGVVEEVGTTLDGIKYIKVFHCLDVHSVIENVDIVGVAVGDVLKKGQDIATAIEGSLVTLKLFDTNSQIRNLSIHQSKIVWEN